MEFIKSFLSFINENKEEDFKDKIKGDGYFKGLSLSTARKKAAELKKQAAMDDDDPAAYGPLPGDTKGKKLLKPSKHTKKYQDLYGDEDESVNESMELKKLKDAIKMFQDKIAKQGRVTNARDEEHLDNLIRVYKEMGGKHIKESVTGQPIVEKAETGLYVYPSSQADFKKLEKWLDASDYYGEVDDRRGFVFFPEEKQNYDALEMELDKEFVKAKISARFEGE